VTPYALRASPDSSLNIGYCDTLSGRDKEYCTWEGAYEPTYSHVVFRGERLDGRDGVGRDPDDRDTRFFKLNFLCTRPLSPVFVTRDVAP
jgi:hypothetical protein